MNMSLGSINPFLKRIRRSNLGASQDRIAGWALAQPAGPFMNMNRMPGNGGQQAQPGLLVLPGGPTRQPGYLNGNGNGNGNGYGYPQAQLQGPAYGYPIVPQYSLPSNCGFDPQMFACGEDYMYGVDSGSANIAGAASATISVTPQKRHIPQRMSLSENMANTFVITDIRVGVEPVLITTGAISASVFIQDATAPNFRSVVCEVGNTFSVTVTNITGAIARFTATVIGRALPY